MEGLTEDIITPAANTLAAVKDTWDNNVGHLTERKDRGQEREDTLTPELMQNLVQLTSPAEQSAQKFALKVTDWTVLNRPPVTPTASLTCHQHT